MKTNESRGVEHLALRGIFPSHPQILLNRQLMLGLPSALSLSGIRSSYLPCLLCCWIWPFLQPSPITVLTTGFSTNSSSNCNISSLGQATLSLARGPPTPLTKLTAFLVYVPGLLGFCFPPVLRFSRAFTLCLANCFPREAAEKLGAPARPP